MSELFLLINDFTIKNPNLMTWSGAALIVLLGLMLQKSCIKEYISEWKLNHLLKNIGVESLHNINISDGMDGNIFIENLILTKNNILLLGVKKFRGVIFAADNIDLWTQVVGNKSYKFDNPLRQLESDALVLNSKLENSKIIEKVLFIKGSEFPKGKPDNIIEIEDLKEGHKDYTAADISDALRADWELLLELSASNDMGKDKGIFLDKDSTSSLNVFSLVSFLFVLSLWLVWRLLP